MGISPSDYQSMLARTERARGVLPDDPQGLGVPCGSEADLHYEIMDECRRRGWQFLHGSMSERTHRTLGEPDFTVLANGGRVLFVECKSAAGKLTKEQQVFKAQAERNGHVVHVVRSFKEFMAII